jgi:hypothetical protein
VAGAFTAINTFLVSFCLSPFPPGARCRLADYVQPSVYEENLRAVVALVPDGASVCAQSDIHPHLSQRRDAALFPRCWLGPEEVTEYVIVDLDATSIKSPLDYHAFYQMVDLWLGWEEVGVVVQQGGVLLLQRGASRVQVPEVQAALQAYGRRFYRVAFTEARLPRRLRANRLYEIPVSLRNTGSQCWDARGQLPVRLSYRWWADGGLQLPQESLRTNLPHRVKPGNGVKVRVRVLTPEQPGRYTLEWDLVREGDAWFKDKGAATLRHVVTVE